MSIEMLVMVVLGGLGSISGSIISAIVLTVIPEMLQTFASWKMIIYSLLLVLVMIFRPSGLMGDKEFSVFKLKKLFQGMKKNETVKKNLIQE